MRYPLDLVGGTVSSSKSTLEESLLLPVAERLEGEVLPAVDLRVPMAPREIGVAGLAAAAEGKEVVLAAALVATALRISYIVGMMR